MKLSFFALLGLLFIGLKLTGYIAWSWWLVLMPLYLPALIVIVIAVVEWAVYLAVNKSYGL